MNHPVIRAGRLAGTLALALGLLVPAATAVAGTPAIGRLFLTPAERQVLDRERARGTGDESAVAGEAKPAAAAVDQRLVLNGVLRPRHGTALAWVNGRQRPLARPPDAQNRVSLSAPGTGSPLRLKPGQSWDPVTRRVRECGQCAAPLPDPGQAAP
ncbi:MAG: hypothetical protein R3E92_24400 [Burkholderiaceae bacterium]|nr:MAG: hypothetical protein EDM71_03775 [Pseudomonadota bacterium]MBC6944893.1 hypothetical protein [Gammaproteobacteria bacterium]MCE7895765.1 hypothetical protein [Gammaproteobacteria bacterium PRO8]MDL1879675.1 hypothetical protein [Gammaproteobacteria bacterium PRO2]MCL4777361.1 hypothetical protein [Gammaproteobacteria bacterium]